METMLSNPAPARSPLTLADKIVRSMPGNLLDLEGAIYFVGGQVYLLTQSNEVGRGWQFKAISSTALRIAFSDEIIDTGWLPPHLIRQGVAKTGHFFVIFQPPTNYNLTLELEEGQSVTLAVALPALLFGGVGQSYFVWAVKEAHFDPKAALFHAPLPNVDSNGRICMGGNPLLKVGSTPDVPLKMWSSFIGSGFNSHLIQGKSRGNPLDIRDKLVELADAKATKYPLEDLSPLGTMTAASGVGWYLLGQEKYRYGR